MKKRVLGPIFPRTRTANRKRNIMLLDSSVAGFRYYSGEEILRMLEPGRPLALKREPQNLYDYDAVEIYHEDRKLGYIPRSDSMIIAQLMDKGVDIKAWVSAISDSPDQRIGVAVEMIA